MNDRIRPITLAGAIAIVVIAASACNQAVSSAPSPEIPSSGPAMASPSPIPSSSPAPTASAPPTFATDTFVVTISADLRVRSKPEVSDASRKLTPLLPIGTRLFVVSGPVTGSGFDWYLVAPTNGQLPSGWVAAGRAGEPWLDAASLACPVAPSTASQLARLDKLLALACFGGRPLTFDALLGSWEAQCGVEPCCDVLDSRGCLWDGWLIDPSTKFTDASALSFVFDGVDQSALPNFTFDRPIRVRVTGQLDHAFARGCLPDPHGYEPGLIPALGVLRCRTEFVVTSVVAR